MMKYIMFGCVLLLVGCLGQNHRVITRRSDVATLTSGASVAACGSRLWWQKPVKAKKAEIKKQDAVDVKYFDENVVLWPKNWTPLPKKKISLSNSEVY